MGSSPELAIAAGGLVIVSGVNGYIASHVADQLLLAGYRVRGTVRSLGKGSWMPEYFSTKYGPEKFELVEVPNMAEPGAFDHTVKGASGFIHVATPVMVSYDPNEGIPIVVNGTVNALKAAANEPSITRFVLTSSSTAAASPQPNKEFVIDENTWNDEAVKAAWMPPPYEGEQRKLDVYSASKTEGERAAWKFIQENKPDFEMNAILPNCNMGLVLSPEHQGAPSTVGWIKALWNEFKGQEKLAFNPPQYYVNVQDTARVHVGALIYADVKGERLIDFAYPFNWNDILAEFRKLYPDRKFMDDMPDLGRDLSKVANQRAEELVKRFGRPGWTNLTDTIRDATAGWT